jgi:hypothetical protein
VSYDVDIWTARKPRIKEQLKEFLARRSEECYVIEIENTSILIFGPDEIDPEDIPESLQKKKSIKYKTSIGMEGSGKKASALLKKVCKKLADENEGFIEDMQASPGKQEKAAERAQFSVTQLTFNTTRREMNTPEFADRFLALLEKYIPEALPRRYGTYDPPKFEYARTGREHLVKFLSAPREVYGGLVNWRSRLPVVYVFYYAPEPWGWQHFRHDGSYRYNTGQIQIGLMADAYAPDSPNVKDFWQACTSLMRCFYSEVRLLRNQRFMDEKKPWYGLEHDSTEAERTVSPYWQGPPIAPAGGVFFSGRYAWAWPLFWLRSRRVGHGRVVDCLDTKNDFSALARLGKTPAYLRMHKDGRYPAVFPFRMPR